ncbi:hypothetical protein H8K52_13470 [Undibacterium seohonense]|uniref:Leucine-rich repeat domain-containing protein n=1 Tax=Undibacterium seohonense TaxID=1344950 RepID=A0ABR6X6T5_9BURK|nr:hypothetical protein [Undibacterium seohonense]MBC3808358.1 hypothetical protein [Undibacterium seohonense]
MNMFIGTPLLQRPGVVHVSSPVNPTVLRTQLSEETRLVVRGKLTADDAKQLAECLKDVNRLTVCLSSFGEAGDLGFLDQLPHLYALDVHHFDFADFDALNRLPESVEEVHLSANKSNKLSLKFLEKYPGLKRLSLDGQTKSIESLTSLTKLQSLTLRSITLPDVEQLTALKSLVSLDIKLGGTRNLDALPRIGRIKYLELWQISGLTDLSAIGDIINLQYLFLDRLKNVAELPSFRRLANLRRVELSGMKGLTNLRPVSDAPNLEELSVGGVRHLEVEDFQPFLSHSSLKAVNVGLGSTKRNEAVANYLKRAEYCGAFEYHEP